MLLIPSAKEDCVYTNNNDVFVQFGTRKACKFFKNQLNCTSPEVLNLPVSIFFKLSEKTFWLLIDNIQGENKKKTYGNCAEDSHLIGYL